MKRTVQQDLFGVSAYVKLTKKEQDKLDAENNAFVIEAASRKAKNKRLFDVNIMNALKYGQKTFLAADFTINPPAAQYEISIVENRLHYMALGYFKGSEVIGSRGQYRIAPSNYGHDFKFNSAGLGTEVKVEVKALLHNGFASHALTQPQLDLADVFAYYNGFASEVLCREPGADMLVKPYHYLIVKNPSKLKAGTR